MLYTNAKDLRSSQIPRSRFKGSSLPQYGYGAMLTQAGNFLGSDKGASLLGNFGQLGNVIGGLDATDGDMNPYAAAGAGALKGVGMGAKLGNMIMPGIGGAIGAGAGALIGGAAGLYKERQQQAQLDEAEAAKLKLEQQRKRALELANLQASKAVLSTYPTQGVADAGFMAAYGGIIKKFAMGGPTDPPPFDMSLLAGNTLPAPNQMAMSAPDVLTGYSDQELAINRAKGNQVAFNQRADIVGENLNNAYQYAKENPLDAVQVGLGATAIAAEGIPLAGTAVSGFADGINAGISGGRAAYYANKGDTSNAAFYTTAAALDGAAAIPGLGNAAGASKIAMLLNKANHVAHAPIHAAHTGSKAITAYKAGNLGYGATNSSYAMGGKIPTESADYLAEGGEVIQHAMNDRPDTDMNGEAKQINSNTSKFVGDSHDAASQGIGVANDKEARIYSKRLYAPKDLVAKLNKL